MKVLVARSIDRKKHCPEAIIDPLCCTVQVAERRGKTFIYENGFIVTKYRTTLPFRAMRKGGDLIQVLDTSLGEVFKARATGGSINVVASDDGTVTIENDLTFNRYTEST